MESAAGALRDDPRLAELFAGDAERGDRLHVEALGLYLDYSKNRITSETLQLLLQLAEESGLRTRMEAMFRGEKINITENRSVLHVALRAPKGQAIVVDGVDVVPVDRSGVTHTEGLEKSVRCHHLA